MSWIRSLLSICRKQPDVPPPLRRPRLDVTEQYGRRLADALAEMAAGYRLQHQSSFYAAQFRTEDIQIVPYRPKGYYVSTANRGLVPIGNSAAHGDAIFLPERHEHGRIVINTDGADLFTVRIPSARGAMTEEHIALARKVLEQIVEMDAEARRLAQNGDEDYEESLNAVEIKDDKVEFHYVAGTCNTEWWINFDIQIDASFGPLTYA